MSELIEDREITSIPSGVIQPTPNEIIEEQVQENILEVKNIDELDLDLDEIQEPTQIFKKPMITQLKKKKKLSERQIAHLKKMRERKKEKAKLKKINKINKLKPVQKQEVQKPMIQKPMIQKPIINNTNNFNFDQFLGNVDKMINVLNKWNTNTRPQQQPQSRPQKQQIQKPVHKVVKSHKKVIQQPSTMDFLNINCRNNFRRPFE